MSHTICHVRKIAAGNVHAIYVLACLHAYHFFSAHELRSNVRPPAHDG
jgi:hypothetical protein